MHAPMQTVATTNQRYEGRRAIACSGGGSRPWVRAARNVLIESGPGEASVRTDSVRERAARAVWRHGTRYRAAIV